MANDELDMGAIEAELVRRAPGLAALIERCGPCTLGPRRDRAGDHFESLASSIVYQQLAGKSAGAIWARVRALAPDGFLAERLAGLEPAVLRAAGLSGAKAAAMADLARRVTEGSLDLGEIARLEDEDVVARLIEVRGIGPWTAQMFLMFTLGRIDVWPTGDLGVRRGYAVIHGLGEEPSPAAMEVLGDLYRPWRSVMAWYCWRALDEVPPAAAAPATPPLPDLPTGR